MLLEEEAALTREIIKKSQKSNQDYLENLRLRAEEAKKQQEEVKLSLLKAKRAQQYLARCPDARDRFVKKSTQDVKYCNLVQMAENNAQREAEKELEMMWHGLMLKEVRSFIFNFCTLLQVGYRMVIAQAKFHLQKLKLLLKIFTTA